MKTRICRSLDQEIFIAGISESYLPLAGFLSAIAAIIAVLLGTFTDVLGAICIFLSEEIAILVLILSVQSSMPWKTLRARLNSTRIPKVIHFRKPDTY